ncbi:MAG: hypothetical protein EOP83_36720 [Verrucomicrobiaceae bacterium]|nr:MAG: hypothetical protein EOP83_36720 [Verrucomicrobiaceae bacterium]
MSGLVVRGNAPPPPSAPGALYFDTGRYAMMCFDGTQWVEVETRPQTIDDENYPYLIEGPTVVTGEYWQYAAHDAEVWLITNGYNQHTHWISAPVYTGVMLNRYRIVFGFKDETLALQFKILWGGEPARKD